MIGYQPVPDVDKEQAPALPGIKARLELEVELNKGLLQWLSTKKRRGFDIDDEVLLMDSSIDSDLMSKKTIRPLQLEPSPKKQLLQKTAQVH